MAKAAAEGREFKRQAARGHKPREHVIRQERAGERIEAWARSQAAKSGPNTDVDDVTERLAEAIWSKVKKHGMDWFHRLQAEVAGLHADYVANRHKPLGYDLDQLAGVDMPREAYFYH